MNKLQKFATCVLVSFAAALGMATAHAQACPPGQYPVVGQGWNYCAPAPGAEQSTTPTPPPPAWRSRWQSIVTDVDEGVIGTSVGKDSPSLAERSAISDCKAKGGASCKVQITNADGCVALVTGDKVMNTNGAPTKEEAEGKGIRMCENEDNNCRVYYSACNMPERIR